MSDALQEQLQAALGDHYAIERELTGGGMSRTFVAEERELGRRVVVKVLPPDIAAGVSVERFRREIQLAARLQHPHIVPLLSAGARDGLLYYTMPFIAGESLRGLLTRTGELPIDDVLRLVHDVVDALTYAHASGVVHRDIKPDNVLISGNHAVVTDFGVSKALASATSSDSITSAGVTLGTPAYMAPEQASAESVDHRADLYAVGAMTYELLTGRPPFVAATAQQVLAAHISRVPEPIRPQRETVPEAIEQLVMRCLEKRPADRWQSATELLTGLEGARNESREYGRSRPRAVEKQLRPRTTGPWSFPRLIRRPAVIVATATLLAAVLAGAYYIATRQRLAHRIAIIPLIAPSTDTTRDLMPEFLTEELRTTIGERIARVPGLSQINSVSADHFRGTTIDFDSVRTKLRADRVVQLGFFRAGSELSLLVELVNTKDKTARTWRYRRDLAKLETRAFAAQIAQDVVEQGLGVRRGDARGGQHQPTEAALAAYTRGAIAVNQINSKADVDRAVSYFEAAMRADSAYAQPLARMALAYQWASGLDGVPPSVAYPAAESGLHDGPYRWIQ